MASHPPPISLSLTAFPSMNFFLGKDQFNTYLDIDQVVEYAGVFTFGAGDEEG